MHDLTGIYKYFFPSRIQVKRSVKSVKSRPSGRLPLYQPTWRTTALAPERLVHRSERASLRYVGAKRQQVPPTLVRVNHMV